MVDTDTNGERGEITESDFEGAAIANLIDILLTTPAKFKFDSL